MPSRKRENNEREFNDRKKALDENAKMLENNWSPVKKAEKEKQEKHNFDCSLIHPTTDTTDVQHQNRNLNASQRKNTFLNQKVIPVEGEAKNGYNNNSRDSP